MSVAAVCDSIAAISGDTTHEQIATIAKQCESFLGNTHDIIDVVENTLCTSDGLQRLALWYFVDRLAKQHSLFLDALRRKMVALTTNTAPPTSSPEWAEFVQLLKSSFTVLFGAPLVSLVLLQLTGDANGGSNSSGSDASLIAASGEDRANGGVPRRTTDSSSPSSSASQGRHRHNNNNSSSSNGSNNNPASRSQNALSTIHQSALRRAGGFVTKAIAFERPAAHKHTLQVKTIDSQMAMHVASSYAPAKPVEIRVPELRPDGDAGRGYMKAVPRGYDKAYEDTRRKRLRDIMARHREEQDRQQEEALLQRIRREGVDGLMRSPPAEESDTHDEENVHLAGKTADEEEVKSSAAVAGASRAGLSLSPTGYADVQMPAELPRDEFGVKRGNFPLGVRFVRNAIAACGGAVELDVIVNRLSTLSNREAVSQFGNVREFLLIHSPTFRLVMESGRWIVRLTPSAQRLFEQYDPTAQALAGELLYRNMYHTKQGGGRGKARRRHDGAGSKQDVATGGNNHSNSDDNNNNTGMENDTFDKESSKEGATQTGGPEAMTWQSMTCPGCSKVVKGRSFARHYNSRRCITAQIALGLQGDYTGRGVVAELAFMAKHILSRKDSFDDGDIDALTACLGAAAQLPRLRLASPRQFTPILKAVRLVRDRWLRRKGSVPEMDAVTVRAGDASVVQLFAVLGAAVHRLPIAWIEMGEVIDMCHRFTESVLPPLLPPPRPADPRISLSNAYPGFLFCESELDDDDEPSGDEDEFSDDEAPTFTFAPPVDVAESLFTAGFERDTKRLQHRMRTAPPMVLQRVLQGDRTQTQREMYTDIQNVRDAGVATAASAAPVRRV